MSNIKENDNVKIENIGLKTSENDDIGIIKKCYDNIKYFIWMIIYDPNIVGPICVLVFLLEAMLLELIIIKIPYTEIDYSTYMQQITQIQMGELDYNKIGGDTGPIVYPGGYVFIYSWMKAITEGINDIGKGQEAFRLLYLMTFALTCLIYIQASGEKKVKPYQIYMLALSKRLHSIYVLRLFNDCFATFFVLACIFLLQIAARFKSKSIISKDPETKSEMRLYSYLVALLAVDSYCFGVSVKMNVLLYLPGLIIILYFLCDENLLKLFGMIIFGIIIEIGINFQFLTNGEKIRNHFIKGAFDFSRQFMYKWTVNWKFIDKEMFSSDWFHRLLFGMHIIVLLIFIFKKWVNKNITGKDLKILIIDGIFSFYKDTISSQNVILNPLSNGYYIANVMMMSNLIGILFARSLHYQFLSWYYYSIPFILGHSDIPMVLNFIVLGIHEWCWNKYPTSSLSSGLLVTILLGMVFTNYSQRSVCMKNVGKVLDVKKEQ
ncbi:dolichyl-P-Man:Man(5)GlcNAc(2)-PP-dolichol alpha-1,3-mannosyltransferase [Pichia californica]|uniref:Dol-P-Man:Man(5)GlcNAc(2)-PP-Dol alpha-1,3-mannosyltransferase n=1 Tax=Pichia californica TaxID=460514 RepID=A0A9P6WJR4_9ASCO|nr:dolichyl-P-Man:Man(5)GlcNAc(2)-PP-dolichol alpha-1,3-mannosyltransferase [[Candida] californica]KAG0688416.1 dolichyl-P-Man:Man(5)GlcNAc(2)-PP-dolichol alpha-1,3-mannosyltransferase [[Candida] californica]